MRRSLMKRPLERMFPLSPWGPRMESMMHDMMKDFDDFFSAFPWMEERYSPVAVPRSDIYRKDGKFIAEFELPGIDPSKGDLKIYPDRLVLNAERSDERQLKEEDYFRAERYYGNISRVIHFPEEVDPDSAHASYKNGILTIEITEKKHPEECKVVEIKSEDAH